jgi:hypothetical protein
MAMTRFGDDDVVQPLSFGMQSALQSRRHAFDLIVGYVVEERQRQGARCDRFRHGQMCGTAPGRISMAEDE